MRPPELDLLLHTMPSWEVAQYHCPVAYGYMINLMARYPNALTYEELLEPAYGAKDTSEAKIARITYCNQRVLAAQPFSRKERVERQLANYRTVRDSALGAIHNGFSWDLACMTVDVVLCIHEENPWDALSDLKQQTFLEIYYAWCAV